MLYPKHPSIVQFWNPASVLAESLRKINACFPTASIKQNTIVYNSDEIFRRSCASSATIRNSFNLISWEFIDSFKSVSEVIGKLFPFSTFTNFLTFHLPKWNNFWQDSVLRRLLIRPYFNWIITMQTKVSIYSRHISWRFRYEICTRQVRGPYWRTTGTLPASISEFKMEETYF